ncbi:MULTISPECIES: hypothetical protein [Gammaproteobacteria]|uniref:hypothetical protein n=1 Tax=Gammaproteobacteria TaxID=1236 RepID=UPI000DD0E9F4|nr:MULTISPECIES: hypothetical protein [Gammaproteobacteria]RTE87704.1 hypothetical protein DQX04_04865 [Aliidiomarina sp. B3213]TCZ92513.1 hypothetical protein EYQ95_00430 [Lysobacter sp. N42]
MEIYLVGGAVRDKLLGLAVKEKDYVVVGATADEMLSLGYSQVGKDFPVFLHPETHEEYALARTERKSGSGYTGFECFAEPSVTLEEDLLRRDLTINALAQDSDGNLIDPYHGQQDLEAKLLRHVSPAFVEDPLRVLRVARFAARFHHLGFQVAEETMQLMQQIVERGEIEALTPERVWMEMRKALCTPHPAVFFQILSRCGALTRAFEKAADTETAYQYLSEGQDGTLQTLSEKHRIDLQFALWYTGWAASSKTVTLQKLPLPKTTEQFAQVIVQHKDFFNDSNLTPEQLLDFFQRIDAWRQPERLTLLEIAFKRIEPKHSSLIASVFEAIPQIAKIDVADALQQRLKGPQIGEYVYQQRLSKLASYFPNFN